MPRDSNGVFSRIVNYVAGTKARANDVNTNELDIAEALTDSLRKSSSLADVPDKAAARSALGVPSASDAYTRFAVHDFAASPTSLLTYDLPETASRFRCSLEGITPANVEVLVSMRCGVTGQAPDQGADDYATSYILGSASGVSGGSGTATSCVLAAIVAATFAPTLIIVEGVVGSAAMAWQALMSAGNTPAAGFTRAERAFVRRTLGARRRLVFQVTATAGGAPTPLTLGRLLLEVKS